MKNQNPAKVAIRTTITGTTTAGMIVLRLDDELWCVEALDAVEEALLECEDCGFELDEAAAAAATDSNELYTPGSVTTEAVTNVVGDVVASSSTGLSRVTDTVVNEVGAAAVTRPILEVASSVLDKMMLAYVDASLDGTDRLVFSVCEKAMFSVPDLPLGVLRGRHDFVGRQQKRREESVGRGPTARSVNSFSVPSLPTLHHV